MARMTYMGNCIVDGEKIACTSMSGGIETSVSYFDHTIGLRDINFDAGDVKESAGDDDDTVGGYEQTQKKIFRYSPSLYRCKFAGPIAEHGVVTPAKINIKKLINAAIKGGKIKDIDMIYIGGSARSGHNVTDLFVESMNINIAAGDVSNFDFSLVSKEEPTDSATIPGSLTCGKLLTWDKCEITSSLIGDVQAFSISIKNNVVPIFTSTDGEINQFIKAKDLRFGMQEVSGTISTYGFNTWEKNKDTIIFKLSSNTWKVNVVYSPSSSSASGGTDPYISSTQFYGVSDDVVWPEEFL